MKEVKKLEFVFENCESMMIPIKFIGSMTINDISTKIERFACNYVSKMSTANEVVIFLNRAFKKINYYPFGKENFPNPIDPFNRIADYNDITCINVFYDDGTEENYYVDYVDKVEGQLGSPNINQTTYISEKGNMVIKIGTKTMESYLEQEDFDNIDEMVDCLSRTF